jgi:hypothetical protein
MWKPSLPLVVVAGVMAASPIPVTPGGSGSIVKEDTPGKNGHRGHKGDRRDGHKGKHSIGSGGVIRK